MCAQVHEGVCVRVHECEGVCVCPCMKYMNYDHKH